MTKPALTRADLPPALQRALDLAVDAKAVAPVVLQLTDIAGYTDWALVVSGRSATHVGGISDAILAGLKDMQVSPIGTDGLDEHLWDLLDYDDFLIHAFYHPVRKHYDLESMWRDAPRVDLGLPPEVMDTAVLEGLAPPVDMPPFRGSFGAFPGELDEDEGDEAAAGEDAPGELPADDEAAQADEDYDDAEGDYGYEGDEDEDDDDTELDPGSTDGQDDAAAPADDPESPTPRRK